jgi:hypothetical protein
MGRELEDLAAHISKAGGAASVSGNSSGALLALDAARAKAFEDLAKQLDEAAAGNRRSEAVEPYFTKVMQMPAPAVAQMRKSPMWPGLEKLAHTLSYDLLITARGLAPCTPVYVHFRFLAKDSVILPNGIFSYFSYKSTWSAPATITNSLAEGCAAL